MKWIKRGLIFDPADFRFPHTSHPEFAQSPQALVLDDRIRIYFSTREREPGGKFLSHIAYVDFDRTMRRILGVSCQPVIPLGKLGCFDEHGIFPMNVVRHEGSIYGFTCGWSRRVSVSVETSIGLAISRDGGVTFERAGDGPVLTSSLHEPCLVGDPFVLIRGATWHMWYIYGTVWLEGESPASARERVYKIGHATSPDGFRWCRQGVQLIADRLNVHECQALPTVFEHQGRFHMYFCYREATGFRQDAARGYRLGYAWSDDLRHWSRDDEHAGIGLSEAGWDSEMMCYPHVFRSDGVTYLLYNGNEFGRKGFGMAEWEP